MLAPTPNATLYWCAGGTLLERAFPVNRPMEIAEAEAHQAFLARELLAAAKARKAATVAHLTRAEADLRAALSSAYDWRRCAGIARAA